MLGGVCGSYREKIDTRQKASDSTFRIIDSIHERSAIMESMLVQGYDFGLIQKELPEITTLIQSVEITLQYGRQFLDIQSLRTFNLLLEESVEKLDDWRGLLLDHTQKISLIQKDIDRMKAAPLLLEDESNLLFVELYDIEFQALEKNWRKLKTKNEAHQKEIQRLQTLINRNYYKALDLQRNLTDQIQTYSVRMFGKEANYLWEISERKSADTTAVVFTDISFKINQHIIARYFSTHFLWHIFSTTIIFLLYFFWVRKNYGKVYKMADGIQMLHTVEDPHTISRFPILSSFIVVFSLWPFLDLKAPEAYLSLIQFFLFIVASVFIFKYSSKKEKKVWVGITIIQAAFMIIDSSQLNGFLSRVYVISVHVFIVYCSVFFLKQKNNQVRIKGVMRQLLYIVIAVQTISLFLNLFGRVTISNTLINAGFAGFVQIIALSIFKDVMVTAIQLHNIVVSSQEKSRVFIDMEAMSERIYKFLSFISLYLCFAIFATNLNFYGEVHKGIMTFLFDDRTIGNTTFKIGNILFCFFVIYLSTLAQKYVGYLFDESTDKSIPAGKTGSKIALWKLIIIVLGFAIAIMVSGLPLDKVTIVLGAFGVGIGLGLQNVVNNFVSGLILIFERPLQIGDYIEVAGLKGWVKNIGIRATTMVNNDGAEIIVPNGSILAGNLTNWTLSNSKVRVEMQLLISPPSAITRAKEIILEEIDKYEHTVRSSAPGILQTGLKKTSTELKVSFWIDHINRQESSKSIILNALYVKFDKEDIDLM
jgi:small-conductance mechanosensitive channel